MSPAYSERSNQSRHSKGPLYILDVTPCSLVDFLLMLREKALPASSECKSESSIETRDMNVRRLTAEAVVKAGETREIHAAVAQVRHETVCRDSLVS
jgi:hypothetical protein